jgi:chitin disaccharide deacetylase
MKTLCVCIDDYGLHEGINDAVIELTEMGRAHAVGCMTAAPAWRSQAARLQAAKVRGVDIGLHLDFTENFADQRRMPLKLFLLKAYMRQHNDAELRTEIIKQLNAFEDATGFIPDFVDGHQHVHQLPQVRSVLLGVLTERYAQAKPWLRSTVAPSFKRVSAGVIDWIKPLGIELLGANALRQLGSDAGFRFNRRLLGVYDFEGGQGRYARHLAAWLSQARSGDVLMCHPSKPAAASDGLLAARLAEFAVWRSSQAQELLNAHSLTLASLSATIRHFDVRD